MDPSKRKHDEVEPEQLNTQELLSVVSEMMQDSSSEKDKKRIYRKKYPQFVEGYPVLFEMACRPDFDFLRFQQMLALKDSVEKGRLTQHDASVKVGKSLYDVYVKDKVEGKQK